MSYPYPRPYPTFRECPKCHRSLRLVEFRRWVKDKRILHDGPTDVCNGCAGKLRPSLPEQSLDVLKTAQRMGRINPIKVSNIERERREAALASRSDKTRLLQASKRAKAWNEAVLNRLRDERNWCRDALRTPTIPDARRHFFEVYLATLMDVITQIEAYLIRAKHGWGMEKFPLMPTERQAQPATYLTATDIATLRRLYAECAGVWTLRDPWFLEW